MANETDVGSSQDAMLRGTIIHEAIRLAGRTEEWQPVLRAWDSSSHFSDTEVRSWQETIRRFLTSNVRVLSEHPFDVVLDARDFSLWLRGVVDRLEIQGGKGRLVDFKTGRWNDETAARAARQLNFYAMAWRKGLWPEVMELRLCIVHLDERQITDIPLNPDFEHTLEETARNALRLRGNLRVA